jgi:DNA polymerase III sliding clamp (beta) subunit (PCNA family)
METQTTNPTAKAETAFTVNGGTVHPSQVIMSGQVNAIALRLALETVQAAMSKDPLRYVLNGVCFKTYQAFFNNAPCACLLDIVATDGKRLNKVTLPLLEPFESGEAGVCILSANGVTALIKALKKVKVKGSAVRFGAYKGVTSGVTFEVSGAANLTAKCVDGNYPNYNQVIPHLMDLPNYKNKLSLDEIKTALAVRDAIKTKTIETVDLYSTESFKDLESKEGNVSIEPARKVLKAETIKAIKDLYRRDNRLIFDQSTARRAEGLKFRPYHIEVNKACKGFIEQSGKYKPANRIDLNLEVPPAPPGCDYSTAINPYYLEDGLKAAETFAPFGIPQGVFIQKDKDSPLTYRIEGDSHLSFIQVIMPQPI